MANKVINILDTNIRSSSSLNRGAWTADEDRILAQYIDKHGPRRWKSLAIRSGLNRCGKSCRLRWLNYLRPDIKRGNFSDAEQDLILRLHRLLGNRWSLIAGRLPGRTDNEIKNYWNAHLRKKAKLMEKLPAFSTAIQVEMIKETEESGDGDHEMSYGDDEEDEFFDFSTKGTYGLDWVKTFLELEEDP
ncbi:hypothetical protein DH2020_005268 [Rehmannia glutinosa]|uniref:R2R3-MYB protein n=1 Tax=Rehmannia glutinosa TaxID=99300 RepID=A0ABR0XFG5_REHGL